MRWQCVLGWMCLRDWRGPFCYTAKQNPHKAYMRVCVCQIARMKFSEYVASLFISLSHSEPTVSHRSLFRWLIDVLRKSFVPHIPMIMWLWSKHLPNNHHNDTVCNSNIHVSTFHSEYMRSNIIRTHTSHTWMRMLPSANNTIVTKILRSQHTYHAARCFFLHLCSKTQHKHIKRRRRRRKRLPRKIIFAYTHL